MTLREVVEHNSKWFSLENRKFFGDINYQLRHGKSGHAYLTRKTAGWSDMFDGVKKIHFRINPVSDEFKILPLIDAVFKSKEDVKNWLKEN